MARLDLNDVKQRKNYYRDSYRRVAKMLFFSLCLNAVVVTGIVYKKLSEAPPRFYATNAAGSGFITPLKPLDKPNMTSQALLAADPPTEGKKQPINF